MIYFSVLFLGNFKTYVWRHRKLMHLGPTGSKTPCHICKQVHGRHSQFYKDGRDAKMPYRNPTPTYSEFPGHTTLHASYAHVAYMDTERF